MRNAALFFTKFPKKLILNVQKLTSFFVFYAVYIQFSLSILIRSFRRIKIKIETTLEAFINYFNKFKTLVKNLLIYSPKIWLNPEHKKELQVNYFIIK